MFLASRKEFGKHKLLAGSTRVKRITPADLSGDGVRPVPSSSDKNPIPLKLSQLWGHLYSSEKILQAFPV